MRSQHSWPRWIIIPIPPDGRRRWRSEVPRVAAPRKWEAKPELTHEKAGSVADAEATLRLAAANGDLATVRSLHEQGADLRAGNDEALRLAAAGGHLEIVRYMHQNGVGIRSGEDAALRAAAAEGQLAVVRYLHQNGVDVFARDNEAFRLAAAGGHLHVLRYLHENGGDLRSGDDGALREAAAHGHLDVVKYLHENGVDVRAAGDDALRQALANGHLNVVSYLHENGADLAVCEEDLLRRAEVNGYYQASRYVRRRIKGVRNQQHILIFQHLAKTAGTTLGNIFRRNFPPEEQLPLEPGTAVSSLGTWLVDDVRGAVESLPPETLDGLRFVGGHVGFGIHALLPRPAKYVTLLRDPVDRLISGFYYSISDSEEAAREEVTFEEYIFRKRHYDLGLNDSQLRVISGLPDLDPIEATRTEKARPVTEADFAHVRQNLESHYLLVGLTERFDEFLVVLCRLLGWNLADAVYVRQNATSSRPRRDQIPHHVIAEAERHDAFDRRLYALAQNIFDEKVEAYGPSFREDLAFFRHLNQLYREGTSFDDLYRLERESRSAPLVLAAANGRLETVISLHQQGALLRAVRDSALRAAAKHGHLDVVRYLHENGVDIRGGEGAALCAGAGNGQLEVVRYLHEHGVDLSADDNVVLRAAAAHGHLHVLRYLHENGVDIRRGEGAALRLAAAHGHLDIIRYFRESGTDLWTHKDEMFRLAAANGHLATVRYLHEYGADPQSVEAGGEALRRAAAGGHLEVVRYLHQNGADFGLAHAGAEALRLAAAGGHRAVVKYLHENGAATADLSEEGRACIEAMSAEISAAPAIYHPSTFWKEVGTGHTRLLSWTGEANFKRTVNQNFFNFIPADSQDPRIAQLDRLILPADPRARPDYRLESPDCDPGLWTSWLPSYQIFRGDRRLQEELYLDLVRTMYEFVLAHDPEGILQHLEEPLLGKPIRVWRGRKLISQDLANSVWERNVILGGLPRRDSAGPLLIAELGAGYGRLGHVLLASTDCRYMVFDIPPALYLAQWYLSSLFPEKRVFRFRPFHNFSEVEAEVNQADIAFFTANQLEKFPASHFDVFINISSLHEMRRDQIGLFLAHMTRTSRRLIYLKEYKSYRNPYDGITIERSHYALPDGWEAVLERPDVLNPDFFELLARPSVESLSPSGRGGG